MNFLDPTDIDLGSAVSRHYAAEEQSSHNVDSVENKDNKKDDKKDGKKDAPIRTCFSSTFETYSKSDDVPPENTVVHQRFESKSQYLMAFVGKTVGPGNYWRFPLLAFENQGGAFVVITVLLTFLVGVPLLWLELVLGQFSGQDCVRMWDVSPAFRGVGFSSCVVVLVMTVYIQVFMAYCLYYFFSSFADPLPWTVCKEHYVGSCFTSYSSLKNTTHCSYSNRDPATCGNKTKFHAAEQFFREITLSSESDHGSVHLYKQDYSGIGLPSWQLLLCLLGSWILVICFVSKGIRYTRRAVYLTVVFPYLGLIILFIVGFTLEGALSGISFLFANQNWDLLSNPQIWIDAVGQTMLNLGVCTGSNVMFGTFSDFRNKPHFDAVLVAVVDLLTSLLASTAIFTVVGHVMHTSGLTNVPVLEKERYGILFVLVPYGLSHLPVPQLWTALFFFMLYLSCIDNVFVFVETVFTYLQNDFRIVRRRNLNFRVMICMVLCTLGITFTTPAGPDLIEILDHMINTVVIPLLALFELVAIIWIYGVVNLTTDIQFMLEIRFPWGLLLMACIYYGVLMPIFLLTLGMFAVIHPLVAMEGKRVPWETERHWQTLGLLFLLPILMWFLLHMWGVISRDEKKNAPQRSFFQKLTMRSVRWLPNDGATVHRNVNTIFADIFPTLKRQHNKHRSSARAPPHGEPGHNCQTSLTCYGVATTAHKEEQYFAKRSFEYYLRKTLELPRYRLASNVDTLQGMSRRLTPTTDIDDVEARVISRIKLDYQTNQLYPQQESQEQINNALHRDISHLINVIQMDEERMLQKKAEEDEAKKQAAKVQAYIKELKGLESTFALRLHKPNSRNAKK